MRLSTASHAAESKALERANIDVIIKHYEARTLEHWLESKKNRQIVFDITGIGTWMIPSKSDAYPLAIKIVEVNRNDAPAASAIARNGICSTKQRRRRVELNHSPTVSKPPHLPTCK